MKDFGRIGGGRLLNDYGRNEMTQVVSLVLHGVRSMGLVQMSLIAPPIRRPLPRARYLSLLDDELVLQPFWILGFVVVDEVTSPKRLMIQRDS